MLMWVKISSIEQLGYLVVVTTNKNYKVSVKDSAALEKSGIISISLESPHLSIEPEIPTQLIRTDFLEFRFSHVEQRKERRG